MGELHCNLYVFCEYFKRFISILVAISTIARDLRETYAIPTPQMRFWGPKNQNFEISSQRRKMKTGQPFHGAQLPHIRGGLYGSRGSARARWRAIQHFWIF